MDPMWYMYECAGDFASHGMFFDFSACGLGTGPRGELEHLGFGEASAGWAQALREPQSRPKTTSFFGPFQNGGGLHPGRLTWNLKMMGLEDDFPFQLGDF